jgi:spermidine synthase
MKAGKAIGLFLLAVLCLSPLTASATGSPALFEGDSIYNHIKVQQDGPDRCMVFGRQRDLRQTCVNLAKPDEPLFEYTAMMFAGFLFLPETKRVCLIGLGGGYIPTVFRMHLPGVALHTVEVDPMVDRLARDFFNFRLGPAQTLAIEDGRQFLKRSRERYDQIWLDAFNSDYIPAHMTTREFLELVKSRLSPNGVVVQNVFGGTRLYDAQIMTFRAVFKHVFVLEGRQSGSHVIVAADSLAVELADLRREAEKRGGKIGRIDLLAQLQKLNGAPSVGKAPVLTDDYNPANLLLMQKN